jgi:hypothetical protein
MSEHYPVSALHQVGDLFRRLLHIAVLLVEGTLLRTLEESVPSKGDYDELFGQIFSPRSYELSRPLINSSKTLILKPGERKSRFNDSLISAFGDSSFALGCKSQVEELSRLALLD